MPVSKTRRPRRRSAPPARCDGCRVAAAEHLLGSIAGGGVLVRACGACWPLLLESLVLAGALVAVDVDPVELGLSASSTAP